MRIENKTRNLFFNIMTQLKFNMETTTTETQAQRLGKRLLEISVDVTESDKAEANRLHGYVPSTIWQYLKGDGPNADIAAILLELFTKRIKSRDNLLK